MKKFIKKWFGLYNVEERLTNAVGQAIMLERNRTEKRFNDEVEPLNYKCTVAMQQAQKVKAELVERISRIEVLLADDLERAEKRLKNAKD